MKRRMQMKWIDENIIDNIAILAYGWHDNMDFNR